MPSWRDYLGQSVGIARVMSEAPFSDGSTARFIQNWTVDEQNYLDSAWRLMPLIPYEWREKLTQGTYLGELPGAPPTPFTSKVKIAGAFQSGVVALKYIRMDGEIPELLFLTYDGVFRYTPWNRYQSPTYPGLTEQTYYSLNNTISSVKPQAVLQYPAQMVTMNNRVFWTFCDGGGAWVWDRARVRPAGFTQRPSSPDSDGPKNRKSTTGSLEKNLGGFSNRGRVGTMISGVGFDNDASAVENGEWKYAVAFENVDGSYSATSSMGGSVRMSYKLGGDIPAEGKKKLFRVYNIPKGPPECAARILLRTPNLQRLQPSDFGLLRFLHRIPNNQATDYIDNIPDGELGPVWKNRIEMPLGVYFIKAFAGSMWYLRTSNTPSRIWWSEQEVVGSVPESIMEGHYRDVFPSTGPITGALPMNLSDTQSAIMLVFKAAATHYVAGQYPNWSIGTLHQKAGCAGPSLAQVCPDGSAIWYGNRTFWRMDSSGSIKDIGGTIRKRLQKVNHVRSHMGISWVDGEHRETVFCLPMEDSSVPNMQFIWDYMAQGFRLRTGIAVTGGAETIPELNVTLVAGVAKIGDSNYGNVFVLNRGYPGQSYNFIRSESVYQSGWHSYGGVSPKMHASYRAVQAIVTAEERSSKNGTIEVYADWDDDTSVGSDISISSHHPEDTVPTYGSATYDESVYRASRPFAEKVAIDIASQSHHSIKISTNYRMALYNVDVWGPRMGGPGSRSPTSDE